MEYKNVTIEPSPRRGRPNSPSKTRASIPQDDRSPASPEKPERSVPAPEWGSMPTVKIGPEITSAIPQDNMPAVMKPREGNKYRYKKTIGRGGMKVVLQVYDNDTMRDVAMALLPDISTRSKLELGQFLREARITAGLEHPNIVPVHDIGLDSAGSPYFTMKLLRGETLASVLKKLAENDPAYVRKYSFDNLMRIYTRICNAIAFAHSKGVIHLDLKPENVQIGDFGEVLVLDWGLARKYQNSGETGQPQFVSTKTQKIRKPDAAGEDCEVNGTPGYMAPEQISGSRHACSPQTDIYSLGAILYAMITYQNPVRRGEIAQMLQDTLDGNIERPSERVEGREIPFGIEAVVMKAMSLEPSSRYRSVRELRDEVVSFVDGFATQAEKAGPLKKTLLFMRRHQRSFIFGAVILFLLLLLGIFFLREAHRTISLWIPAFSADFRKPGFPADSLSFRDLQFREAARSWRFLDTGLCPERRQIMLINEVFAPNMKVSLDVLLPDGMTGDIEIALFPAADAAPDGTPNNSLVTFHLERMENGSMAEILESRNFYAPRILASTPLSTRRKEKISIAAEHDGSSLILLVDKKEVLRTTSYLLSGTGQVRAAVRAGNPAMRIQNVEIFRLAPPENATALMAGDTLLEEQLYEKAIRRYLLVDDTHPGSRLAEIALQKAYMVTASKLNIEPLHSDVSLDIKKRIAAKYPDFNHVLLLGADACAAWKKKDYALAVALLNKAFELDPGNQIIAGILQMPHVPLPEEIQDMLVKLIRRTHGITTLDLSNYGLTSLHGISGMQLDSLNCSGNKLTSLEDLAGMQLKSLDCSGNRIESLRPLVGMPIRYLDCSDNRIRDFEPLKQLPLIRLNVKDNRGSFRLPDSHLKNLRLLSH